LTKIKTRPIGVRLPIDLLECIRKKDPDFNLSSFVRCALENKLKDINYFNVRIEAVYEFQYSQKSAEIDAFLLGYKKGRRSI